MPALPLVPRQSPVAPLNAEAHQALSDLQRQQKFTKRLTHHLSHAADQLTAVAEQLNHRGTNYTVDYRKKARRDAANGEEENQQAKRDYEDFQRKLQELTRVLDNGVRAVVDDQTWVAGLPEIIKEIARKAQASTSASERQNQNLDEDNEEGPTNAYPTSPATDEVPSALIKSARDDLATEWASKTLTERYSQHNTYVGFYRGVHDAKNPNPGEDGPPLPHHSLWFANEEKQLNPSYVAPGTQTQRTRRQRGPSNEAAAEDSDPASSDVEIAREKISIKCPITFLPFTEPLTSTKCPHSFDRPAIMDMLSRTQTTLAPSAAQTTELEAIHQPRARAKRAKELLVPAIPCPVCSIMLADADLKPDPYLLKRVQRIQAAAKREREEAMAESGGGSDSDVAHGDGNGDGDDEVAAGRGTQRKPMGLGSSPPPSANASRKKKNKKKRKSEWEVKRERVRSKSRGISVVPQTQLEGVRTRTRMRMIE